MRHSLGTVTISIAAVAFTYRLDVRRIPRLRRFENGPMLAVGVIAVAVRVPGVYGHPFWEDEVASARILVEPTLATMLQHVARTESTPPLWYLMGWLGHRAGLPLQSERLLSVLFGGLFAAAIVLLARRFVAPPLAILAGLMTALGGEFVGHGYELRAYALLALVSVAFAFAVLSLLEQPSRWADVALAATVAAGSLTHFFFTFSVAAALGWVWFDRGARKIRRRATIAVLAGAAAAAAAWAPVMFSQYQPARFWWIGSFSLRYVAAVPLRLFTFAWSGLPAGAVLSVATLVPLAIGSARLARRPAGRLLVVLAIVPIHEAAALWAAGMPIFDLRNLIGVGGFVAIALVTALEALPPRLTSVAAAVALASIAVSYATAYPNRIPPYDAIARSLVRDGWNGSQPIAVYGDPYRSMLPIEWYLPGQPVLDVSRAPDLECADVFIVRSNGRVIDARLRVRVAGDVELRGASLLIEPAHLSGCVTDVQTRPAGSSRRILDGRRRMSQRGGSERADGI